MINKNILLGISLGVFGHMISWFSFNSQFVWDFWKDKPLLATIIFGIPSNLAFWYATMNLTSGIRNVYQVRWVLFGLSFFPMLILTTNLLGQNFFTIKNLLTIILAILIILVQLNLR